MSVLITVLLADREADAVLRSEGFSNGYGVIKSVPLKTAEAKIIGAIREARS